MSASTQPTRVIALDLDGTTLTSSHTLSTKTITTLRRIAKKAKIIIATGRSSPSVLKILEELDLPQASTTIICYNGSWALNVEKTSDGHSISTIIANPIPETHARLLLEFAVERGLVCQYYNGETGEVQAVPLTDNHRELMSRYAELVGKQQTVIQSYEEAISRSLPAKLLILTEDPDSLIEEAKKTLPSGYFHMIRGSPFPFFVEFLLDGISKGQGLQSACSQLGISMDVVVAFGDGENDKEMLELAGLGVAMCNGQAAAKNAANDITEWSNDEDGVALYLEKMEEQEMFTEDA